MIPQFHSPRKGVIRHLHSKRNDWDRYRLHFEEAEVTEDAIAQTFSATEWESLDEEDLNKKTEIPTYKQTKVHKDLIS